MRFLKQLLYGLGFLIIIALIAAGVYFYFLKPAPSCTDNKLNQGEEQIDCGGPNCTLCMIKKAEPLTAATPQVFDNGNGTATIVGEIKNPNEKIGAQSFTYDLNLFDSNEQQIFTKSRSSFVYPNKKRTIVEASIPIDPSVIKTGTITFRDVFWVLAEKLEVVPEMNIKIQSLTIRPGVTEAILQGKLVNNNAVTIDKLFVKAIVSNKMKNRLNSSMTALEQLGAFQTREFIIQIPMLPAALKEIDPSQTELILETVK